MRADALPFPAPAADTAQLGEQHLRALVQISAAVAAAHTLDDVLALAADASRAALGVTSISISRYELDANRLRTLITSEDGIPPEERHPVDEVYDIDSFPLAQRLLTERAPHVNHIDDPEADAAEIELLTSLGWESSAAAPLWCDGEVWGELYVATVAGAPRVQPADVAFLEAVGGQISLALGRAELYSRVARAAYEDAMTGLPNRRAFEERLARSVATAQAQGSPLTVVIGDVNGLKHVNDTFGHEAGDAALRKVGRTLAALQGPDTLAARIGGDEFCIVLEDRTAAEAERLVAGLTVALGDGEPVVRVAWGAAGLLPGMTHGSELLAAADRAQYASKRGGGRRAAGERHGIKRVLTPDRDTVQVADLCVAALDSLTDADRAQRLMRLARELGDALDCARWTIMRRDEGSELNTTVVICDRRTLGEPVMLSGGDPYGRGVVTLVDMLMDASGARVFDPAVDGDGWPTEAAWLARLGVDRCLVASCATPDGTDLLLLYADDRTVDLAPVRQLARLLLAAV